MDGIPWVRLLSRDRVSGSRADRHRWTGSGERGRPSARRPDAQMRLDAQVTGDVQRSGGGRCRREEESAWWREHHERAEPAADRAARFRAVAGIAGLVRIRSGMTEKVEIGGQIRRGGRIGQGGVQGVRKDGPACRKHNGVVAHDGDGVQKHAYQRQHCRATPHEPTPTLVNCDHIGAVDGRPRLRKFRPKRCWPLCPTGNMPLAPGKGWLCSEAEAVAARQTTTAPSRAIRRQTLHLG